MHFIQFKPEETRNPKRKPLVVHRTEPQSQQDIKRLARSTTYMQIPSALFEHTSHVTLDVKLFISSKCGPKESNNLHKNLQKFSQGTLSFEAKPSALKDQNYVFSLGQLLSSSYLSRQFSKLNLRRNHIWVSFGRSQTLYFLYCQPGKTVENVINMLEVHKLAGSCGLTIARERTVSLNTFSKHKLVPLVTWEQQPSSVPEQEVTKQLANCSTTILRE